VLDMEPELEPVLDTGEAANPAPEEEFHTVPPPSPVEDAPQRAHAKSVTVGSGFRGQNEHTVMPFRVFHAPITITASSRLGSMAQAVIHCESDIA
jgi:hypothetical protein